MQEESFQGRPCNKHVLTKCVVSCGGSEWLSEIEQQCSNSVEVSNRADGGLVDVKIPGLQPRIELYEELWDVSRHGCCGCKMEAKGGVEVDDEGKVV